MADEKPLPVIPSELRLNYKWDKAIENFLVKVSIGVITTGLASIVLFRKLIICSKNHVVNSLISGKPSARFAFTAFGAGFGMGDAYRIASISFEKEKKAT
jgi:hypothetical protein